MKKLLTPAALVIGALVVAAAGPASAGPKGDRENLMQKQQDEQLKRENKDIDKAYSETLRRTGKTDKSYDPWGSVRPADKK